MININKCWYSTYSAIEKAFLDNQMNRWYLYLGKNRKQLFKISYILGVFVCTDRFCLEFN